MARFWFGLALLLACCASPRIGEVGPTACNNDEDDDHDGLKDCADPDCQNLDLCRDFVTALDGGGRDGGRGPDGGVIGPPLSLDSGVIVKPLKDSGTSGTGGDGDDDSGMGIPIQDAGPPTCMPECKATEECIDLACKPVTASTSQSIAVKIKAATAANTSLIGSCLDGDCNVLFGLCCPIDPYVQVVQVHADGSKDNVIGRTKVIDNKSLMLDYSDSMTWTVNLAEGDYLVFELWDHNSDVPDERLFDCKPILTDLKDGEQTCNSFIGAIPTSITADLKLQ